MSNDNFSEIDFSLENTKNYEEISNDISSFYFISYTYDEDEKKHFKRDVVIDLSRILSFFVEEDHENIYYLSVKMTDNSNAKYRFNSNDDPRYKASPAETAARFSKEYREYLKYRDQNREIESNKDLMLSFTQHISDGLKDYVADISSKLNENLNDIFMKNTNKFKESILEISHETLNSFITEQKELIRINEKLREGLVKSESLNEKLMIQSEKMFHLFNNLNKSLNAIAPILSDDDIQRMKEETEITNQEVKD